MSIPVGGYATVAAMVASSDVVAENDRVTAGVFQFLGAASGASDNHLVNAGGSKLYAIRNSNNELTTTQLNWDTADCGADFAAWISGIMVAGDTLIVDDFYDLTGDQYQLAANVTLRAATPQVHGFDSLDATVETIYWNPGTLAQSAGKKILMGTDCVIDGLLFTMYAVPQTDASNIDIDNLDSGGSGHWIQAGDDGRVTDCKFTNMYGTHAVYIAADRVEVDHCWMENGNWTIQIYGEVADTSIHDNHITGGYETLANGFGDGIKTSSNDLGTGNSNTRIYDNVFSYIRRDALDTTGGFFRGQFINNQCIGCGVDLKDFFQTDASIGWTGSAAVWDDIKTSTNAECLIADNVFTMGGGTFTGGLNAAVVLTTQWGVGRTFDPHFIPRDISFRNNVFVGEGITGSVAVNIKDGKNIVFTGDTFKQCSIKTSSTATGGSQTEINNIHFRDIVSINSNINMVNGQGPYTIDYASCTQDENMQATYTSITLSGATTLVTNISGKFFGLAANTERFIICNTFTGSDRWYIDAIARSEVATEYFLYVTGGAPPACTITGSFDGFQAPCYTNARALDGFVFDYKSESGELPAFGGAHGTVDIQYPLFRTTSLNATIVTGTLWVGSTLMNILTEASASTDDLDTLYGGGIGSVAVLKASDTDDTVVVKHATGNLMLAGAADYSLDDNVKTITVERKTDGNWWELARA